MLIASVSRGEWWLYDGCTVIGKIHRIEDYFVPQFVISPGHIRFGRWMDSFAGAKSCITMMKRGEI